MTFKKEAKRRRQIILVTHNPYLAVVADAEQIVHVSLDTRDGRLDFDFFSGAIEESPVNRALVDILEGMLPVFGNHRLKYRRQSPRATPQAGDEPQDVLATTATAGYRPVTLLRIAGLQ